MIGDQLTVGEFNGLFERLSVNIKTESYFIAGTLNSQSQLYVLLINVKNGREIPTTPQNFYGFILQFREDNKRLYDIMATNLPEELI